MTHDEFAAQIERILGVAPGSVRTDMPLAELEGWDSLAMLGFVAMADSKLGTTVRVTQLTKCKSVDDLAALFPGKVEACVR